MSRKDNSKAKNLKNIITTLIEVIIVAAIIFGGLMYVQHRLQSRGTASTQGKGIDSKEETQDEEQNSGTGKYNLVVNIKKNALIVYETDKDNNEVPTYVFQCSVGDGINEGKGKVQKKYTWLDINKSWHKYNSQISENSWIQSVNYSEKYSWTLNKKSYNSLGEKQKAGSCILLTARDAKWIYDNCGTGTKVKIVKGSKKDVLPMEPLAKTETYKKCGWDPTDTDEANPYLKLANSTIAVGDKVVYVEKGTDVKYLENIIAINANGQDVTSKLKYNKIDSGTLGKNKVKFTYKNKAGEKFSQTVVFKVIDTTCPKVTLSTYKFKYEVKSASIKDYQKDKVKKAIEDLVKSKASCDESGVTIKAVAFPKDQLEIGDNSVKVIATDESGNIGNCEATVELVIKETKLNKKPKVPESTKHKKEETITKKSKEETTTKKKSEETTTQNSKETTSQTSEMQTTANLVE